jgi:hypothetical protein
VFDNFCEKFRLAVDLTSPDEKGEEKITLEIILRSD